MTTMTLGQLLKSRLGDLVETQSDDISPPTSMIDFDQAQKSHDEQPLKLPHDPLVLSCASHRIFLERGQRWRELSDCVPTPQDHAQAQAIRKLYGDRILMRMLKNERVTDFQHDLYQMLTLGARNKHQGMLHRLPYFYHEDQERERLFTAIKSVPDDVAREMPKPDSVTLALTPIAQILRSRRRMEMKEFWFRQQDGYGVNWAVDVKNPLFTMIDGLFDRGEFTITCLVYCKTWRDTTYLVPQCPRLA